MVKIVCIGAGYVGGPTMAVIALKCPEVTIHVFDISQPRIDAWNAAPKADGSAFLPIYEPGLEEIVLKVRGKNLFFTSDSNILKTADIVFIAVNTPTKMEGIGAGCAADLTYIESCARMVGEICEKPEVIVVEKSTVPVRCSLVVRSILNTFKKPTVNFSMLSNPEFLAEGTAICDLLNPDRVLIGGESEAAINALADIYAKWVPRTQILTTNLWSSELSKLVANAFLAQRISSINSISPLCEKTGASVSEIRGAIGRDKRIGSYFLNASVGFGGSCFQKDILNLIYICQSEGLQESAEYWMQVVKMNDYQKQRFYEKTVSMCNGTLRNKKIAVYGFAFKKDTGDTRESAAIYIVSKLLVEGAKVHIYDPKVPAEAIYADIEYFIDSSHITINCVKKLQVSGQSNALLDFIRRNVIVEASPMAAIDKAAALMILTEWDEFKTIDYKQVYNKMLHPANLLDGRLILDHKELVKIGFNVFAVGMRFDNCHI